MAADGCLHNVKFRDHVDVLQGHEVFPWQAELMELSPLEEEEVRFRRNWVAYLWGRAAVCGIETELSRDRAEYWGFRLGSKPTYKEILDLQHASQELLLNSIEVRLWAARGRVR